MGTSTRPVLTTRPARANTLVPLLVSVPIRAYQSPPLRMIGAMLAKVSTLLIRVGLRHSPETAGYGGRGRGVPRPPWTEAISAVSSPHTNAPAPRRSSTWNSKGVSAMPAPSSPARPARRMAVLSRATARGYSARQ